MNEINNDKTYGPDELIYHINSVKEPFYKARKRIFEKYKNIIPTKIIAKPDIDFTVNTAKCNADEEIRKFQKYIEDFNNLYVKNGDFISKYFEYELNATYNCVNTILSNFYDISIEGAYVNAVDFGKFSLILSAIEFHVNLLKRLQFDAQKMNELVIEKNLSEKRAQQEIQRIQYESEPNKNYKNNIRKFVNNICSQITSDNPAHSLGRLHDLIQLLNRADVPLVGTNGQLINLNQHPRAIEIFWEFLRNAVIVQAQTQFFVNIETAIVFSSLLAAVLGRFPDQLAALLELLTEQFSHLLKPIDVDDEFVIDEEDQLNDLIGLARLVAGISVAHPPPGFEVHPELGPAFLWSLLARLSNEHVVSPFTAQTMIGLLEIGGHSLWSAYGHQFEKLLVAIQTKFEITNNLTERSLNLLITTALSSKSFEHVGYLTGEFWTAPR